jgi:hypothetical protein
MNTAPKRNEFMLSMTFRGLGGELLPRAMLIAVE